MGLPPERYLWALLQASWEAEGKPELRKRYLSELVEASAKVPPRPGDLNWIGMEGRAINALRELGRFDEALARLDKVPARRPRRSGAGRRGSHSAAAQARSRRGWRTFFTAIRPAIERRDSSHRAARPAAPKRRRGPLPRRAPASSTRAGRAFCEKESAAVAEIEAARDKLAKEAEALRRSREASGR